MIEIGRLCIKIAGRDSRKKCVVVDIIDDNFVMIDGETRRKKCNIKHLELLDKVIKIRKGSSHDVVVKEFKTLGIEIKEKKSKERKERPKRVRKKKEKKPEEAEKKSKKKAEKKVKSKEEEKLAEKLEKA